MPAPDLHISDVSARPVEGQEPGLLQAELERWFGQRFVLRDATTGHVVSPVEDVPLGDEEFLTAVTPATFRKGRPLIVAEEAGCCFLAIPLHEAQCVAISPFQVSERPRVEAAARLLGIDAHSFPQWVRGKSVWGCDILERMAGLFMENVENARLQRLGIHSANIEHYRHQSDFLTGVVRAFTSAIDAKDPYTCGHSDRVARLSVCLARQLGLEPADLNLLYMSGLLHDVGKIGIDDAVLRKTDRLTDEEYEQIKLHPELGCDILKDLKPLVSVLPVVRHHHEQWDGKGYPYGLKGLEIPELARITAVADSYDAMSSDRPYRRGMPDEKVDAIFHAGAGSQWDPQVVEAFFACRDPLRELIREERANLPFDVQAWIE
ncbi:MAG: HD-GYP domain-containing protein [Pirellulaceae bacterium]